MDNKQNSNTSNRKEALKEITDKLEEGIMKLMQSEKYTDYLKTMSKFHNYSFNNTILIAMQKPDASLVAGYEAWKKFGRQVQKGEKGIKIIAPMKVKRNELVDKLDTNGKPVIGSDGKIQKEKVEVIIPTFKVANVFDVSQTEGKELPSIGVNELAGQVKDYSKLSEALISISPVPVEVTDITSGAKGYFSPSEQKICIKSDMSEAQTLKTLVHEISHSLLHDKEHQRVEGIEDTANKARSNKEVEAESVAYSVCNYFGLDTSDYSFAYIAGWSKGKDLADLKESLNTIRLTTDMIINKIEDYILDRSIDVNLKNEIDAIKKPSKDNNEKIIADSPRKESFEVQLEKAKKQLAERKVVAKDKSRTKEGLEV